MEDDYIIDTFLYPNYKQIRGTTRQQIADCHTTCRLFIQPGQADLDIIDDNYEPPTKKLKYLCLH